MSDSSPRPVGRPYEGGRTSKVVRIPKSFDPKVLCDLYILMSAQLDGRREGISSGAESTGRDWTRYDRLMLEVASILDS
jgi:hypothetical protein